MIIKDIARFSFIVCLCTSCSSRFIQSQVNKVLENNPWHGPATEAFYTFTWLHYRIPESIDELVTFLEMDRKQASKEELKYIYFGNIEELIADLKNGSRRFISETDSCFYYTDYGLGEIEAVKQYSPRYYLDHLPRFVGETPNILDRFEPVFLDDKGYPILLPILDVASFKETVRQICMDFAYQITRCDLDSPLLYQTIISYSRLDGISMYELLLPLEKIRIRSNAGDYYDSPSQPHSLSKEVLERYKQLCQELLQSYPEIESVHFLAGLATIRFKDIIERNGVGSGDAAPPQPTPSGTLTPPTEPNSERPSPNAAYSFSRQTMPALASTATDSSASSSATTTPTSPSQTPSQDSRGSRDASSSCATTWEASASPQTRTDRPGRSTTTTPTAGTSPGTNPSSPSRIQPSSSSTPSDPQNTRIRKSPSPDRYSPTTPSSSSERKKPPAAGSHSTTSEPDSTSPPYLGGPRQTPSPRSTTTSHRMRIVREIR